jgi:hypothetical protein
MSDRLFTVTPDGEFTDTGMHASDLDRLRRTSGKALTRRILAQGKRERGEYVSNAYLMEFKNRMHLELELSVGERYVWYIVKALIRNKHEFVFLSNTWIANCLKKVFGKNYTSSNISKYIYGLCEKNFLIEVQSAAKLYMFNLHICHVEKQHRLWERYMKYDFFDEKGVRDYVIIKDMDKYFENEIGKTPADVKEECKEYAYITLTNTLPKSVKLSKKEEKENEGEGKKNMFRYF